LEMSKERLRDAAARPLAQQVLAGVLDAILRLVQPIMPFVAESIWQAMAELAFERGLPNPDPAAESVVIAPWPQFPDSWKDQAMEKRMARMQDLVRAVREIRNRYITIDAKTGLHVFVRSKDSVAGDLQSLSPFIQQLAGVKRLECGPAIRKPKQAAGFVHADFEAYVSLEGLIDVPSEIARLEKQLAEKKKHLQGIQLKLGNEAFVSKAPAEVVQQQRDMADDLENQIKTIQANLEDLKVV
jgi:valyl-tRNA synthetase